LYTNHFTASISTRFVTVSGWFEIIDGTDNTTQFDQVDVLNIIQL